MSILRSIDRKLIGMPLAAALIALILAMSLFPSGRVGASIPASLSGQASTPAAPTGLTATAGPSKATLAWTNPNNDTIDYYEYQQKVGTADYGAWAEIPNSHKDTTSVEITGLAAGVAHRFKIRARNSTGAGVASAEATATPTAPLITLFVTAGNGQATIRWELSGPTAPSPAFESWSIAFKRGSENWGARTLIPSGATNFATRSYIQTGLTNERTYTSSLNIEPNALGGFVRPGWRAFSNNIQFFVSASSPSPTAAPAAPAGFSATAGAGKVTLRWTDPGDDTITRWQYRSKRGGRTYGDWTNIPSSDKDTASHEVTGLTNGTAYAFQVRAVNPAGYGAAPTEQSSTPTTAPTSTPMPTNAPPAATAPANAPMATMPTNTPTPIGLSRPATGEATPTLLPASTPAPTATPMPKATPTPTVTPDGEPSAVFGGLEPRLVRVWHLESATQTWLFYDPELRGEGMNTLTGVSAGQIVVIIISGETPVEFRGVTLYPGLNLLFLE